MILPLVVLASVLAAARADCEACIAGRCHSRKTLIQGFHVSDQMAIDRLHNVLYVQLNSNLNTAVFLEDLKIRLVQTLNTSGLTVDHDTQILYTADNKTLYKHEYSSNKTEVDSTDLLHKEADLLFYKDVLYYTLKCCPGLYFLKKGESRQFTYLLNYTISDLVLDKDSKVYFVANDIVYLYNRSWFHAPEVITQNNFVLSTDKYGDVYFGDAKINAIYKMDNKTNKLVDYAAYTTGSVLKFVFDANNDIVFHDSADGSVNYWKPGTAKCSFEAPHDKYVIKERSEKYNEVNLEDTYSYMFDPNH